MKRITTFLFSTRLMAVLFVVFASAMGAATFIENDYGTQTAKALVYNSWWFEGILLLFVVNFFGNIFRYRLYKKEKWAVLLFHLSFILILIGAGITRYISYEGIMPIKEGETSKVFFSEHNYLKITLDNNKEQRVLSDKLLLSAWGKNNYVYDTDFRGQDVRFNLTKYVPNAYSKFVENESEDLYLHFVESSDGKRHDHYIKRGTLENIHGILVGFEHIENALINFEFQGEQLKIRSQSAGTFLRMADQVQGTIAKDTPDNFNYLSLYSIAGLSFVVPKPPLNGLMETASGSKDDYPEDQLTFEVRTAGQQRTIVISGGQYTTNPPEQFSLGGLNFRVAYGSKELELPFSIKLNDFQLEKYPGSESAMSYASEITVIDSKETFDFRIYMNHILDHSGYRFFQSSYNITPEYEETHLSVNHDYWGTLVTYLGYFLLYTGLILILFVKNTRFSYLRKQLQKIQKKKSLLVMLLSLGITAQIFAKSETQSPRQHHQTILTIEQIDSLLIENAVAKFHAEKFSELVIQDAGGRMKPIHTFASQLLRKVSKKDSYKGLSASQVFLSILENPKFWFQVPLIYLERGNDKLRLELGIDSSEKHARLIDFIDDEGGYKIKKIVEKAQKKNIQSKFEKDVINVDRRVGLLYSAIGGAVLKIFPIPNDLNDKWVSQPELFTANFSGIDSVFVRQILPIYIQTLQEAKTTSDYTESNTILEGIKNFQKKHGSAVYPSQEKIQWEIWYNKYNLFKSLFKYFMYVSLLLFVLVIYRIFKSSKTLNFLIKISIGIVILLFTAHTAGLVLRWFISGHAPWSNAYESMIYVAWATMLFGLLFGKRSTLTIAATAFLSSMILMIAHWNWMDPEIANLVPVLNSYWLMIHVAIIVASYGPFALAMILGVITLFLMGLITAENKEKLTLTLKELTIINEMSMTVGLVMLTIGNFLGGMWANESWGRYWGWDPKETWALISIMVYAFVLHTRLIPGLRSRFNFNLLSVLAFSSIMMTYFGVNFYLSGLHSYASGDKIITPNFVYYSFVAIGVLAVWAYVKPVSIIKNRF